MWRIHAGRSCLKKIKGGEISREGEIAEKKEEPKETILNPDQSLGGRTIPFSVRAKESHYEERRKERKQVDLDDLKKTLHESLDKYKNQ